MSDKQRHPLSSESSDAAQSAGHATAPAAQQMAALANADLTAFFGPAGAVSRHLPTYEQRPSQVAMAEAVKRALLDECHAVIEAPTGTGKSIAYLAPALLAGKTIVVATANKSLQSQLHQKDIPFLSQVLGRPIDAVLVKGRSNFVCTYKWQQEAQEQQRFAFVDREHQQITFMRNWLADTETGDIDDLPFLLDSDLRPRIVSYPDDCLHDDCPFYHDNCWVNHMRDRAAEAEVLITNHHLLLNALELGWAGERILPPAPIYIVDEAHQLEQTATAVFETSVTDFTVEQLLSRSVYRQHLDEDELDAVRFQNTLAFQEVANLDRSNAFRIEGELEEMKKLASAVKRLAEQLRAALPAGDSRTPEGSGPGLEGAPAATEGAEERRILELAMEALSSAATKLTTVARAIHDGTSVRYAVRVFDRRRVTLEVHAAPIDPAALLSQHLFHPEDQGKPVSRVVICTSATLASSGHFEHFKRRCGIQEAGEEHVLPAVFDYAQQALLYQPALPAYNWRQPDPYYDAVAREIERLLEVSRGRTLCLFTSWSGLDQVNHRLQDPSSPVIWPVRAQGDAPRDTLLEWFRATPYSVLLATRSFWEGVDIPGDDLSLVILDKMPFPTPGDPLHSARMKAIEEDGGNSFGDYMLPLMTLALKQGFGRLIRRNSDRGVVAILDERLTSKGYGQQALRDLPPARLTRSLRDVHRFFQAALGGEAEFAVNVWARAAESPRAKHPRAVGWRWQALRLQDGMADRGEGAADLQDTVAAEVHAAVLGLRDLRARVEKAGRLADQFAVEIRCSAAAAATMGAPSAEDDNLAEWVQERARWKAITWTRL